MTRASHVRDHVTRLVVWGARSQGLRQMYEPPCCGRSSDSARSLQPLALTSGPLARDVSDTHTGVVGRLPVGCCSVVVFL